MMSGRREGSTGYSSRVIKIQSVRSWSIIIGAGVFNRFGEHFDLSGYSSIVLITDANVKGIYGQDVVKILKAGGKRLFIVTLPVGERAKSLRQAERGYKFLLENNVDRQALICGLGGGVVGDLAGYIAATYLRGIDYIQLPTTLLAQVDSSIGGKVGVNFSGKKNMIGSFYQPRAIISDVSFLKSLPPAEMRNGMAEVIKYGLAMDEGLFHIIDQKGEGAFTTAELVDIVMRCCHLKTGVVEADEMERSGQRAILNFGHTVGHALEALGRLQRRSHGEAVAVGMMAAARISGQVDILDISIIRRIENLLLKFGLPTHCQGISPDDLIKAMRFDKKTTLGRTGWVLLKGIGKGIVNQTVKDSIVSKVLDEMCR